MGAPGFSTRFASEKAVAIMVSYASLAFFLFPEWREGSITASSFIGDDSLQSVLDKSFQAFVSTIDSRNLRDRRIENMS